MFAWHCSFFIHFSWRSPSIALWQWWHYPRSAIWILSWAGMIVVLGIIFVHAWFNLFAYQRIFLCVLRYMKLFFELVWQCFEAVTNGDTALLDQTTGMYQQYDLSRWDTNDGRRASDVMYFGFAGWLHDGISAGLCWFMLLCFNFIILN